MVFQAKYSQALREQKEIDDVGVAGDVAFEAGRVWVASRSMM